MNTIMTRFQYIILVQNQTVMYYIKDSYAKQIRHYYLVNKHKNYFDYFNLLSCTYSVSILFVECNKAYEIICGYMGVGQYSPENDCLNYIIKDKYEQDSIELDILKVLNIRTKEHFRNNNLIIDVHKTQKPYNDNNIFNHKPEIQEYLINLEFQLYQQLPVAFNHYFELQQKYYHSASITQSSLNSFHAIIGHHNNVFTDCVNTSFSNFEEFIKKWTNGLYSHYKKVSSSNQSKNNIVFLVILFQNPEIQKYIYIFLERNFYRNYKERTRTKPAKHLTELYIGDNSSMYTLLITPVFRRHFLTDKEGHWENDTSEIRRCNFTYWTIGHLLKSGYILGNHLHHLNSMLDIYNFYYNFYERTVSPYEKAFIKKYILYLQENKNENIPLLIPEFRYGGSTPKHLYRLDFLIINIVENKIIGIELSPNHHIKGETEIQIFEKWEYEMAKRNNFFETYNIPTITFTQEMLKNINECWKKIIPFLQPINEFVSSSSYNELMNIQFSILEN